MKLVVIEFLLDLWVLLYRILGVKKQIFDKTSKRCSTCTEVKPASEFHKSSKTSDGLYTYCKSCSRDRTRAWYQNNKDRAKAHYTNYRATNPRIREAAVEWRLVNVAKVKGYVVKQKLKKFGLLIEDYNTMLLNQGGVCAICRNPETLVDIRTGVTRALSVDHCHLTGRVRGLLCNRCNRALGLIKDDISLCDSMKSYLSHEKTDI